ncbi:MAG: hypothetical protein IPM81_19040 [Saprospirales bacterium]|nr:hypothetical protein [Saprospirales bacterium]
MAALRRHFSIYHWATNRPLRGNGKQILDGALPYRDVYEMKPPLLLYSYAALVALFGYSQEGLHMAAMFLTFWNAAWSMAIGMRFFGRFWILARLGYVLLAVNPFACAILPNPELVLMGFGFTGFVLFYAVGASRRGGTFRLDDPEGNGSCMPADFYWLAEPWSKQSGSLFSGVPAIQLALAFWQQKPLRWRLLLRRGAWLAAGVATPVATCLLLMRALGVWDEFWFWNVQYVQIYSSSLKRDLWALAFTSNFNLLTKNFVLYWVLGAAGLLALGTPVLNGRKRLILLSLAIFSFAAVAPGRRFYGHYWLQFLPVLALAMGALFYHLGKGLAVLFRRLNMQPVVAVAAAVILLLPVVRQPHLVQGDSHRLLRPCRRAIHLSKIKC